MNFLDLDKKLTEQEVSAVENEIAMVFPKPLRAFFLNYNGGSPEPYVYESETLNTVVNETLPLISHSNRGTAVQTYRNLVLGKKIVPASYFPFAVDGGGDYFFCNCDEVTAPVYFYRSDSYYAQEEPLERICESLDEFWNQLVAE